VPCQLDHSPNYFLEMEKGGRWYIVLFRIEI